ncbi:MAG: antibiotic biosynthesis monooxygenase [Tannerella sp.]|jgi:quinol monooxygenase YgiN|nr:antibiotic biosynthesis monooxygenase [Tannerella sp.]
MKSIGIILMAVTVAVMTSCNGGKKSCEGGDSCCKENAVAAEQPKTGKKVIVARLTVKEGKEKEFIEVASKLVEATHQEEGNLFYALYQSPFNPSEFIFYEEYKDQAAFDAHSSSAHFAAFSEGTKDLAAGSLIVDEF